MLLRLFIPIIALISLQIVLELGFIAKDVHDDFQNSYELLRCAREDVYERNITDAILYAKTKDASFSAEPEDFLPTERKACGAGSYAVYRETNDELELLYPNWTFRETLSSEGER